MKRRTKMVPAVSRRDLNNMLADLETIDYASRSTANCIAKVSLLYRASFQRIQERTKKDSGQEFWFQPGSVTPSRVPNLGNVIPWLCLEKGDVPLSRATAATTSEPVNIGHGQCRYVVKRRKMSHIRAQRVDASNADPPLAINRHTRATDDRI